MRDRIPMWIHSCDINPSFFLKAKYNLWRKKMVCLLYQNSFKDRLFIHSHFQLDTLHKIRCSCIEVLSFYISLSDVIVFFSFYTCFNIVSPISEVLFCQFLCRCYIYTQNLPRSLSDCANESSLITLILCSGLNFSLNNRTEVLAVNI